MSYYIVHNNSKSLKHAAPYSTPNSRKRLLARWTAKNLKVFQETPGNANSGIFASFDLVNANNPKEKSYNMQFSFADGTSADKNIIARIRRFFNDAYNRQRGYGFPELTEMEKQQIVARINTAYNQWSGFSHSDSEDHIEHAMNNVSYTRHYGFGGTPNYGTLIVKRTTGEADDYAVTLERKGSRYQFFAKSSDSVDSIKQHLKNASDKILASDEVNNTANLIKAVLREAVSKYSSQHPGYYSPNLKHSDEDANIIDCTSDHIEHAANPYPYRPDVKLDGNQLVITFTDVVNNRTATLSVNLVGAKNYKDVEDRLDNLLQAAYADGKDWANISKNAFDSIMRQARSLNIFNDKTVSNRYRKNKSS